MTMNKKPRPPRDARDETRPTNPTAPAGDEPLLAALHARLDGEADADAARALDSALARDAEAARTAAAFERMARLAAEARAEAPPFFTGRVMARVAEAEAAGHRPGVGAPAWLERLFGRRAGLVARLAPGLLVAALALWIGQFAVRPAVAPRDEAPQVVEENGAVPHRFELAAPEAQRVCLVGDFNGWTICEVPLVRDESLGTWSVQVELPPGRHEYMFVVDDGWVTDPAAPLTSDDGFGRRNAVIYL
jgi:hypothetical protein